MFLFQRHDFSNNYLEPVPVSPNQQGTVAMWVEVNSIRSAQDEDTSLCKLTDLKDFLFYWEDLDLNMDAVFRKGIDSPFCPSNFIDFERICRAGDPF